MKLLRNIQKILGYGLWVLAAAGLTVLLLAAANARKQQVCQGYDILVNGKKGTESFVDLNDILKVLTAGNTAELKGKPVRSFDLHRVEAALKKQDWIEEAELYFNNHAVLQVHIREREPVARIFTAGGESFYIDSAGHRLPLSPKKSARLPVFTGFPGQGNKLTTPANRELVKRIKGLSLFLQEDPFWMAQVSQVHVTHNREFEVVPTLGNHLIELGDGTHPEEKFRKLKVFYQQVLAKTGMEKYERIKAQYAGQIVGVKKAGNEHKK